MDKNMHIYTSIYSTRKITKKCAITSGGNPASLKHGNENSTRTNSSGPSIQDF